MALSEGPEGGTQGTLAARVAELRRAVDDGIADGVLEIGGGADTAQPRQPGNADCGG